MVLFEIPGWDVEENPIPSETSVSKKRVKKDPSKSKEHTLRDAAKNMDALMQQIEFGARGSKISQKSQMDGPRRDKARDRSRKRKLESEEHDSNPAKKQRKSKDIKGIDSGPAPPLKDVVTSTTIDSRNSPSRKRNRNQKKKQSGLDTENLADNKQTSVGTTLNTPSITSRVDSNDLSSLQSKMKRSLDGARFRFVNEMLYKSESREAQEMMRDDPQVFEEYHVGFRSQCSSWPSNPVSHYIDILKSRTQGTVVVDLGCGDAALAKALIPMGLTVLSFDLLSTNPFVVEADVCTKLPLPGDENNVDAEKEQSQIVDVCVCSLSLMSTNWVGCLREAYRVLKKGGELKIAEVTSRISDMKEFASLIKSIGFQLSSKDISNSHFILFEFRKSPRQALSEAQWISLTEKGSILKPCEYKRR